MAKEIGRRCSRCGYAWYAKHPRGRPSKPRWHDEMGAFWTDGQARMTRRVANYETGLQAQASWGRCANCGSEQVKSDASRHFEPTGAIAARETPTSQYMNALPSTGPDVSRLPVPPALPSTAWDSQSPVPVAQQQRSPLWKKLGALYRQHWRIIWTVIFLIGPFAAIGDGTTYTSSGIVNILKFIVTLIVCWVAAVFFWHLHRLHQRGPARGPGL